MNKNDQSLKDILKASKKLKEEGLIIGELRDEKYMGEILTVMSTGHPIDPLALAKSRSSGLNRRDDKHGL